MANPLDFQRLSNFVEAVTSPKIHSISMSISGSAGYLNGLINLSQGYATESLTHANAARDSATEADTSAASSMIVWNEFTSTYIGLNTTDPNRSSTGNAIVVGGFYIRKNDGRLRYASALDSGGNPIWLDATVAADPATVSNAGAGVFLSLITTATQSVAGTTNFQSVVTGPRVINWGTQQLATAVDVNDRVTTVNNALNTEAARAIAAENSLNSSKVNKGGDTMTGPLVLSGAPTANLHPATKQYADGLVTPAVILTKLLTVDGTGSGLDADLLNGQNGSYYANIPARLGFTPLNKAGDTMTGPLLLSANPTNNLHPATKQYVDALVTPATLLSKIITVDGSGSGLDSDLLRGLHWTSLQDVNFGMVICHTPNAGSTGGLRITANPTTNHAYLQVLTSDGTGQMGFLDWAGSNLAIGSNTVTRQGNLIWDGGNDGSGSGLDADTLDGLQASDFLRSNGFNYSGNAASGQVSIGPVIMCWRSVAIPNQSTGTYAYGNGHVYSSWAQAWIDGDDASGDRSCSVLYSTTNVATVRSNAGSYANCCLFSIGV